MEDAPVVAIQPALGAHPQQGGAGLQQAGAGKTEQALVVGIAADAGALRTGQIGQRQQRKQQHHGKRCTPVRRPPLAVLKPHGRCSLPRIGNAVRAPRAVSQACLGNPPSQAALEQLAAADAYFFNASASMTA
ncbi:hypothetical protein HZS93_02099 [Xanthomonas citri]|nr:hypothetical protein HZS93_02099 [Xanthomonas citri]